MAKPLRSDEHPNPKSVQFSHFGVLDTGSRSKGATITSIAINGTILLLIIAVSLMVKNNPVMARKIAELTLPPQPPKQPPPPPKPPPPPPKPLPTPPKIEPPKIKMPEPIKPPPEIKPMIVPQPKPVVITPPAPKAVVPPPAPKIVNLGQPHAASIANNDQHPSAVRMGNPEIRALNGPKVATAVNLGGGIHGMNASNTGSGPHAASVNLGNGSPMGTNLNGHDRAAVPVKGFSNGVQGGTGTGRQGPVAVQIAGPVAATPTPRAQAVSTMATTPTVIYKPQPVYTAQAKANHIEGNIRVKVRVTAAGTTQFLGIVGPGLGYGLNESAKAVAEGMRWKPALDSSGHPVDWVGEVIVVFEMS